MAASLFELETDPSKVLIKSFEVSNKDLLKPSNANPLEIGELVVLSTGLKLVRCADHSTAEAGPYFLFDEKN